MKMHNWVAERLGENVTHKKGYAFKSDWFQSEGIPVVKVTNFSEAGIDATNLVFVTEEIAFEKKGYALNNKDIIIQTVGSWPNNPASVVGKVVRVPNELDGALLNQNAVILRPNNKIDKNFLFYLLKDRSFKGYIINTAQGAANQASITLDSIFRFDFFLPPPETQKKIAAVLSAYDDLIENNNKRIALLEKAAEEIYREWFVRLRFPGWETAVFQKDVPEGWELRKAFTHVKGKSYTSIEINDDGEGMPFVNLKSINRGGGYRTDGLKYYTGRYKENQVVRQNDIIMAVTDMTQNRDVVGRVARIPETIDVAFVISLDIVKIVPEKVSSTFLYSYLRYSGFGHFIKEFANGANVLHLNPDLVSKQSVIIPPKPLRDKFDGIVEPILKQIDSLNRKTATLQKSRDLLLSRLISGKLPVADLDIQFPPSMISD
ncbi:MAG: restriction endonuclease subunit S [Chloroflexi bacterium]|nr:restriction endonuclease subunit S [Chloroflexota bacterium]